MSSSYWIWWGGLGAMLGGIVGILYAPFYALAYFATEDGTESLEAPWVAAWAGILRPTLEPLLTFAPPEVVYLTYGKCFSLIVFGWMAGLLALHARQAANAGRLEKWGFRMAFTGTVLGTLGSLGAYRIESSWWGAGDIEATREILSKNPNCGVLVFTMVEEDDSVFAAMRAGALGYLLKGADKAETLVAIRAVARGEAVFGPGIARRLIRYFDSPTPTPQRSLRSVFPELTDREREILDLTAAGKNNAEIFEGLFLSLKTVRNYVSNVFTKLQVAGRAQAFVRAREAGLGGDDG